MKALYLYSVSKIALVVPYLPRRIQKALMNCCLVMGIMGSAVLEAACALAFFHYLDFFGKRYSAIPFMAILAGLFILLLLSIRLIDFLFYKLTGLLSEQAWLCNKEIITF